MPTMPVLLADAKAIKHIMAIVTQSEQTVRPYQSIETGLSVGRRDN